jgi:hypothetical protein
MLLTFSPSRFYGRDNEVGSILQVITAPDPNSHAIYGIRTIGKTVLLKFLKDPNGALRQYQDFVDVEYRAGGERRLLFVYWNCRRFHEGDNLFHIMLEQVRDELAYDPLAGEIHIPHFDSPPARQEGFQVLNTLLQQLEDHGVRIVFLLDDFDVPLDYVDENDDRLLRIVSDYAVLIIATVDPISELRPDIGASSPLLGILRPEAIGPLGEHAARQLITEPVEGTSITLNPEEQDFLIETAGKQPFLLTAACELYFDLKTEYPELAEMLRAPTKRKNLERQYIPRLAGLPHVNNVLVRIWSRLSADEQKALYQLSHAPGANPLDEHRTITAQLANKSLVYLDIKQGGYRLFGTLLVDFIQRRYPVQVQTQEQLLSQHANQLAENLSPIDRAVFQHLYQHANEVCTFEELLNAVWGDSPHKSKRALEAAVHRLRRNLGENEQIKNIRGRGYKFVPSDVVSSGS